MKIIRDRGRKSTCIVSTKQSFFFLHENSTIDVTFGEDLCQGQQVHVAAEEIVGYVMYCCYFILVGFCVVFLVGWLVV